MAGYGSDIEFQAFLIFTAQEREDGMEINDISVGKIDPRLITNPQADQQADQQGEGTLTGKYVVPARLMIDPDYTAFYEFCSVLPIRTMDSDVLFMPDPDP